MQITVELPDNQILEAAVRFDACNTGYRSVEDWVAMCLIGVLESIEAPSGSLKSALKQWDEDLSKRYEQEAV